MEKENVRRFLLFLVVGGINTLFGYAVFCALLYAGQHYAIAGLVSTILGVAFNFVTTGGIVFENRDPRLLFRFSSGYVLLYGIGVGEMRIAELLGFNLYVASAALLLPNAIFSYLFNRRYVFPEPRRG
ncbi:hypothetical protein B1810_21020 [Panacagrimonas perspica]|nr:hypothetical protein B1810_21020 [Panacagrimonas perspica]